MSDTRSKASGTSVARKTVPFGWAAQGLVYAALAYLVLQMAFGSAPQQTTTTGALQYISQTAPGIVALLVLAVGLLAFAVGRILEVTALADSDIGATDRVQAVLLALVYTSLAVSAFTIIGLAGSSSAGSGGSTQQQGSAFLLGRPGGRWVVGLVGVAIVGAGLYGGYQGVKEKFLGTLRTGDMPRSMRSVVTKVGVVAYVTKGLILALIGYFLLQAALTYDPQRARGLDGALREIAQQSWGQAALTLIAVGFAAYGVFAFVEARYRRVGSSASGTA
jgi:hypothetical protein